LAVLVFLIVMAGAGFWVFSEAVAGGTYVTVPSVINKELSAAKESIESAGLDVGQERFVPNDEFPEYTIIGQRPQPGNVVREGRPVNLTISKGEEFNAIDDYVGQALSAVRTKIEASEFKIASIARIPHADPQNTVLGQDPPHTGEASTSNKVYLLVSDGMGRGELRMPNVLSQTIADAVATLSNQQINASPIVSNELEGPEGVVLAQVPPAGTLLTEGTLAVLRYRREEGSTNPIPESDLIEVTVSYQLPHAWYDREVRIDVTGSDNIRKTVYPQQQDYVNGAAPRHETGTTINQPIFYKENMVVEVFLDGRLARTYRYGPNGEPTIQDSGV
jgi:serine/threonine-protein kinase